MGQVYSIGLLRREKSFPKWICFIGLQFFHSIFKLFALFTVLTCCRLQLFCLLTLRVHDNVDDLIEMLRDFDCFIVVNFGHKVV